MIRPEAIAKFGLNKFGSLPGLKAKDVEVSLPLSSTKMLFMSWNLKSEVFMKIPDDNVDVFNARSRLHAHDKLIASNKEVLQEIVDKSDGKDKNDFNMFDFETK
ncbi:MAG: hypothetical protein JWN37_99 [Candidatus Nomurabacteria bacterium]|nr:hypothetical protein [Candidatus Nomurabacteria bacterium]